MIDKKINTLLTVCQTGNYTRAAQLLDLTQPAVSQQIKQLEQELNVRLFNRTDGELKLTKDGETVLKYAKRIKTLYGNLQQALKDQRNKLDRLSIGITHTAESSPITEILATFSNQK
ncbi:MAG: LysR family transcriptional regulator, partial [Erysipelotrichaceae bacterium]|nr:LysR family transcriptional regulator [Erysipelotrichaceae bacterium]